MYRSVDSGRKNAGKNQGKWRKIVKNRGKWRYSRKKVGKNYRKWLYTFHSTLYTLHFTLDTPDSTLYTLHFILYTSLHSALYTLHSRLHTLHFTLYTPPTTVYTLHCPPPTVMILSLLVHRLLEAQTICSTLALQPFVTPSLLIPFQTLLFRNPNGRCSPLSFGVPPFSSVFPVLLTIFLVECGAWSVMCGVTYNLSPTMEWGVYSVKCKMYSVECEV